jgi:uncharacterized protein
MQGRRRGRGLNLLRHPVSPAPAPNPRRRTGALLALEKVFGRVQSAWAPAQGTETFEIIRRRLFQELDPEGEKASRPR